MSIANQGGHSARLTAGSRFYKVLFLCVIVGLGAFLRLHQLDILPPGDSHDPAQYGVDALQILAGSRPVYLPENYGREAMFSYIVALVYHFTGPGTFGIHLAAAIIGILTIPTTFWVTEEFFKEDEPILQRYGGLTAALALALSYWHLNWSRVGLRAVLVPLFVTITIAFLVRALRLQKRWLFVAGGVFLGLSLYTYQAARILPPLVLMGFLYYFISQRTVARPLLFNMGLTVAVATAVFLPMVVYEWQHPGALNQRVAEASLLEFDRPLGEQLPAVAEQAWTALRVFSFEGDYDPLFTIPGRPSLNIFFSLLFFQGLFITLTRLYWRTDLFLLTWLGAMTVPALIAGQAGAAKRAIGALPAVMILIALGVLIPWKWLRQLRLADPTPTTRRAYMLFGVVIMAGFLYTGFTTYRDYFVIWASDPSLVTHFQLKRAAVGQYIATLPADEQILLSPLQPSHPTIRLHSNLRMGVRGYNGRLCLLLPARQTAATTYIIAPDVNENSVPLLQRHFPQGEIVAEAPSSVNSQWPDYIAYRIPAGATAENLPPRLPGVNWQNEITLLGYELQEMVFEPDTELVLDLYYEAAAEIPVSYTAFVHLVAQDEAQPIPTVYVQHDSEPCQGAVPTNSWVVGEMLRETVTLRLPADLPLGDYTLLVGFYRWPELTRLPLMDAEGRPLEQTAYELATITVVDFEPPR